MEVKNLLTHAIKLLDANLSEMRAIRRELGCWQKKYGWRWNQDNPVPNKKVDGIFKY